MISVTVAIAEAWVTCETDAHYSPDLVEDLATQAASTLIGTINAVAP